MDEEYRFSEDWYKAPLYFRYNNDDSKQIARTRIYRARVSSMSGHGHGEITYVEQFPYDNVSLRSIRGLIARPERPFRVDNLEEIGFPVSPSDMWSYHIDENETQEYFKRADIRYVTLSHLHVSWASERTGGYYEENPNLIYSTFHMRYMIYEDEHQSLFYV